MNDRLLLLHLSDIHFQKPYCLQPDMDRDRPVRSALIQDARSTCEGIGTVDAILISGDIAFHADPEEYDVAAKWLDELATATGCAPERVYTVPGNHDVDWHTVQTDHLVQAVRGLISAAPAPDKSDELFQIIQNSESGPALVRPMRAYNMFAARYDCAFHVPGKPFWTQDLALNDGSTLRIHGLTTTLLSGPEDEKGSLYLGALQTAFESIEGVIRVAMLHHPPDWLEDCDEVDDALWNGSKIHLMGHRHRPRIRMDDAAVRIAASAVNPNRFEGGWEPGYNFLRVNVVEEAAQRWLNVEAYIRNWQSSPDRFVAKRTQDGEDVFRKRISLGATEGAIEHKATVGVSPALTEEALAEEVVMPAVAGKNLVFRFWNLRQSQRREVVNRLGLLREGDLSVPEFERYRRAFTRAREKSLVEALADAIAEEEK